MTLLLDSHAFLWMVAAPERLSPEASRHVADPANAVLVSIVTIWELAIKAALGRQTDIPANVGGWAPDAMRASGLDLLRLDLQHVLAVEHLPHHHRDPFDRLLVAQAQAEGLTMVTADRAFEPYGVPLIAA